MSNKELLGKLVIDGDKLGVIINSIKAGEMVEDVAFSFTTSYEIKYTDGSTCIMTEVSLLRLLKLGRIVILEGKE